MSDSDPLHQQLLGHLLGALDDDEQEWVDLRLERDEEYRRQWMEWRRRLAPLLSMQPDCEPPSGLAERTCRFVAACAPRPRRAKPRRRNMSPDLALPDRGARVSWLDAAAVAVIVFVAALLVPPAIHASRFHSRLASCQERLRQVGLALTEYGYKHGHAISELADNERLTGAGQFAAELLDDSLTPDDGRAVCPEGWLAAQGACRWPPHHFGSLLANIDNSIAAADVPDVGPPLPTWSPLEIPGVSIRDWLGLWRNGMIDGATDSPRPPGHSWPTLPALTCRAKLSTTMTVRGETCSLGTATSISSPVRPRATLPRRFWPATTLPPLRASPFRSSLWVGIERWGRHSCDTVGQTFLSVGKRCRISGRQECLPHPGEKRGLPH